MIKKNDEPKYIEVTSSNEGSNEYILFEEIKELLYSQKFAVLATQGEGQPYTSLISYVSSEDLSKIVFATPKQTRKFNLLSNNSKVSILVDNRSEHPEGINYIKGLTITGNARILSEESEVINYANLILNKHNYLRNFINASSTSLIIIDNLNYFYVRNFQEVYKWTP